MSDEEPKVIHRLSVFAAGPNYAEKITVEGESKDDLRSRLVEDAVGVQFERYGNDDEDYVEIRADLVVKREYAKVEPPATTERQDIDIQERMSRPAEPPPRMQAPQAPTPSPGSGDR